MSIRKKVLKSMREKGLSQKDVSHHIRVPLPTFMKWLDGKTHLPYNKIWMLWEILKLSQEDLINMM